MIETVSALVPESLATFGRRIAAGPGRPGARPLSTLCGRAAFDAVVDGFGRAYGGTASGTGGGTAAADRRALVSLWTQYYLPALLIPYFTALSRLGRVLPIGFERVAFELDDDGTVSRFLLAEDDAPGAGWEPGAQDSGNRDAGLAPLIDGHLRPFFEVCHAHSGLSRRVLWGNAGVAADVVLRALSPGDGGAPPAPARADACLGRCGGDAFDRCPLARAFSAGEGRRRRTCCMRYRIPGIASCGALCPVDHLTKASC